MITLVTAHKVVNLTFWLCSLRAPRRLNKCLASYIMAMSKGEALRGGRFRSNVAVDTLGAGTIVSIPFARVSECTCVVAVAWPIPQPPSLRVQIRYAGALTVGHLS